MKTTPRVTQKREHLYISEDIAYLSFEKEHWAHVYREKPITFEAINFKQAILDDCYFRGCKFIKCDFTGASLSRCNMMGAVFEGCTFDYTQFNACHIEDSFIQNCIPPQINIARDLMRNLRVNYSTLGNYEAANNAAGIEVSLGLAHWNKAAFSNESYYRMKYKGINRLIALAKFLEWQLLKFIWGNGESIPRIFIFTTVLICATGLIQSANNSTTTIDCLRYSFYSFFGSKNPAISEHAHMTIEAVKIISLTLFAAILVRRLSRR